MKASKSTKSGGFKTKTQKVRAKFLNSYYGKPIKDMKLIAITGTTGKTHVAHYVHEILRAAGEQVAVMASDQPFSASMLHKFFSDAWKAGANYVIVTAPAKSLQDNVFYNLPVHIAAMTDFATTSLTDMTPEEYLASEKTLFDMHPENVVLNSDDLNYSTFSNFKGKSHTLTYGESGELKILNSKLYKKGTEATLSYGSEIITPATFLTGEVSVHYMAAAAAISSLLGIVADKVVEGIANYEVIA